MTRAKPTPCDTSDSCSSCPSTSTATLNGSRCAANADSSDRRVPHPFGCRIHRWREKRNEDCRGCRFGYLAGASPHFTEQVSRQSGICHCGILARLSSHSETRLPLDLCRRSELKKATSRSRPLLSTAGASPLLSTTSRFER